MSELLKREDAHKYLCKYQVDQLIFMLEDQKIKCNQSNIVGIEYLCDYEQLIRAVLKVTLRLDARQRLWILQHKRDIVAKFEVSRLGMDHTIEDFVLEAEPLWDLEFGIYLNDDDESADEEPDDQDLLHQEELETEDYFDSQNIMDVYLFNQDMINASQKTVNKILTSDTVQQLVGRVLTETKHKKVLISSMENGDIQKEFLVPALPTYKALAYIDQYAGMYKTGALIFYDLQELYILNTNGKVTAKHEDEWTETTIIVSEKEDGTPGDGMVRIDDEERFYVSVDDTRVSIRRPTIANNVHLGSEAKLIITDDTEIRIEEADQSYIDQRNEYIMFQRKSDNKYSANIARVRMEENECIVYLSGNNLDISAFTPNKTYNFIFDDEGYQEKYGELHFRMAYAYHALRTEGELYMSSSHVVIFKKCPK